MSRILIPPAKPYAVGAIFLISALVLLLLFRYSSLDYWLSAWYFDTELGYFPLRRAEFYEYWMHAVLRKALWFFPMLALVLLVGSAFKSGWSLVTKRWFWLLLTQLAAALCVSFLKSHTSPICPWDSLSFGGKLMEPAFAFTRNAQAGHCFPAGHPSGGWALLAWAYFWRESKPGWSRIVLCLALLLGALMAWVQIARGAHLLSHVLWSLWVCWLVVWLSYQFAWPKTEPVVNAH